MKLFRSLKGPDPKIRKTKVKWKNVDSLNSYVTLVASMKKWLKIVPRGTSEVLKKKKMGEKDKNFHFPILM